MLNIVLNIFFCILSLFLVILAPEKYSYSFVVTIVILFLFQNIFYFKKRDSKRLISFEFFFFIAFFFTNFVYPVFYFKSNPSFMMFSFSFNEDIISKATAVAFFAYSSYILGLSYKQTKNKLRKNRSNLLPKRKNVTLKRVRVNRISSILFIFSLTFFLLYIATGGLQDMKAMYQGDDIERGGISNYIYILFYSSSIILAIYVFELKKSKRFIVLSSLILYIILFLIAGSRTYPLALALILLLSYDNYKKIPKTSIILIVSFGFLFLFLIMMLRGDNNDIQNLKDIEFSSFWDIGADLIINNRNLYILMDYTVKNGPTYGLTILGGILSPIPFGQSVFINLIGVPSDFISSAGFATFLTAGFGSKLGFGSNIVGDVYLAFDFWGIFPFFFFLGWIIENSRSKGSRNIYWNIVYAILLSNSIFIVRSGMFDNLRYIIWGLLLIYIINLFTNKKVIKT